MIFTGVATMITVVATGICKDISDTGIILGESSFFISCRSLYNRIHIKHMLNKNTKTPIENNHHESTIEYQYQMFLN